jgi:Leucine-rich repeat (LRR) protein
LPKAPLKNFSNIVLSLVGSDWTAENLECLSKIENITGLSLLCNNEAAVSLPLFNNLTALTVSGHLITETAWLGKLKKLRELNLSHCPIVDISSLSRLEQLEALNLLFCIHVPEIQFQQLKLLKNLKYLNVGGCSVDSKYIQLNELKNLTVLDLAIADYSLENISELEHLTHLNLSGMKFKDEDLLHLPKNIRALNLSGCRLITADGIAGLSQLENLTDLEISDCELINDHAIVHLKSLKNLKKSLSHKN